MSGQFHLVEKKNRHAAHAIFDSRETAENFLAETVPQYVKRGIYSDKSLAAESFEVVACQRRQA